MKLYKAIYRPRLSAHLQSIRLPTSSTFMFMPNPEDAIIDDEEYMIHIVIKQIVHFGPVPKTYLELIPRKDTAKMDDSGS